MNRSAVRRCPDSRCAHQTWASGSLASARANSGGTAGSLAATRRRILNSRRSDSEIASRRRSFVLKFKKWVPSAVGNASPLNGCPLTVPSTLTCAPVPKNSMDLRGNATPRKSRKPRISRPPPAKKSPGGSLPVRTPAVDRDRTCRLNRDPFRLGHQHAPEDHSPNRMRAFRGRPGGSRIASRLGYFYNTR